MLYCVDSFWVNSYCCHKALWILGDEQSCLMLSEKQEREEIQQLCENKEEAIVMGSTQLIRKMTYWAVNSPTILTCKFHLLKVADILIVKLNSWTHCSKHVHVDADMQTLSAQVSSGKRYQDPNIQASTQFTPSLLHIILSHLAFLNLHYMYCWLN